MHGIGSVRRHVGNATRQLSATESGGQLAPTGSNWLQLAVATLLAAEVGPFVWAGLCPCGALREGWRTGDGEGRGGFFGGPWHLERQRARSCGAWALLRTHSYI